jgi:UDP-N-acetyl-D-glucosamine dehydrogenase
MGFDIDCAKVDQLNAGSSYIQHVAGPRVQALIAARRFEATADLRRLGEADAVIICVPTPLTQHRDPDLRYVEHTADAVAATLRRNQLVCLESTTYPGTTDEIVLPRLQKGGLRVGEDFFLAFSPEREDPGNTQFDTATIPKVVGGTTPACLDLATTLYGEAIKKVVPVATTRVAEATKILENVYRAVNIALVKRAEDRLRADGHQRVGRDRSGQDQAVQVPAVLSRSRVGRSLHPDRPTTRRIRGVFARKGDHIVRSCSCVPRSGNTQRLKRPR